MSDARPLPSQTTTGTGGVSRRYSKTIEITLGPPSTMRATTGTPWPIPALKKEKKGKKGEKNTKPANQINKKRKKKAQTKITEHGGGNEIRKDKTLNDICRKLVSRISTPRKYTRSCPIPITHKRDIISLHIGQPDTPRREVTYRERLGHLLKCWKPHSDR